MNLVNHSRRVMIQNCEVQIVEVDADYSNAPRLTQPRYVIPIAEHDIWND